MNLELSDEQVFLRDAAKQALSRTNTLEAAREALDGGARPDLWPAAVEAGWPGLLVREDSGGAGLGAFDAVLVLIETGRRLAGVELLGHLPASELLDRGGFDGIADVASGETRAAFVAAAPPGDLDDGWTVDARDSMARAAAPTVDGSGAVTGEVPWVVDAPGAGVLVVVATRDGGEPVAVAVPADASGVSVEDVVRYDPTRRLGHVTLSGAAGTVLEGVGADELTRAWNLAQALLAAESVGAVETCLEMAVQYAKERFTFGRPIGSYQAVKHGLVEVMRRLENARSLLYYAGWAHESGPDEFAIAANAARSAAGEALDYAARENIAVHGGIGATWEHDAPLFFRRSQLSRRLLGGTSGATDRVAGELLRAQGGAGDAQQAKAAAATSVPTS
jgi:alkylation response protein AidB-like acyl-CoA dehydrogenase